MMKFWQRLKDAFKGLFKRTSDEVRTPLQAPPNESIVGLPDKPQGDVQVPITSRKPPFTADGIPTTVDMISHLSRTNPKWAGASAALMLREYAMKDGAPWDAYLKGPVKWPSDLLGPGGPLPQPWE